MPNKTMNTTDLSVKHFSRYGEFLASFELSKYGWDIYTPVYDEYVRETTSSNKKNTQLKMMI